ncbi:MAG: putative assembly protein [Syntrophorhabdaceae bacterium PtaU1.Bin034]|nr:MAG: putative assembly protein [Syntrophorhabdaceae bacterium PtaU1.Bin034]
MKKLVKIVIVVIAALLVLAGGLALLAKSYLSEDRMRALIIQTAEKSLDRRVVLGGIDISLFRGIVARDFEIYDKNSNEVFLRTDEFVLRFQFLPLLSKNLVIDKLRIVNARVNVKANADGTYNFSDMVKPGKVEDQEKAAGLPVNLNVKNISLENVKISYTDPAGKLAKADAVVNAEMRITGKSRTSFSSEGTIKAVVAQAVLRERNKTLKDINAEVNYKADLDMEAKQAALHALDIVLINMPVHIRGSVNYAAETAYSLDINVPGYNLAQFRKDILTIFLPAGAVLGGNVSAQLNVNKKPGKDIPPAVNGRVKLARTSIATQAVNLVLDGLVKLQPEIISLEGLKLIAGQNAADITGSVRNYMTYPDINMKISSRSIVLDDLIPSAPATPGAPGTGAKKEPEPMNLKMHAVTELDIDSTRYKGIAITNFRSRGELKDNVLKIPHLNGNTLGGAVALTGTVDLGRRGYRYSMTPVLTGVKLEQVTKAFAPKAADKLFGSLSGKADISGAGTVPENVKRNLKGKGEFAVNNGSLRNSELSARLLAILGLQDLREIPLERANGRFTIANGTVNLTSTISSTDLAMDEKGTIGMDEKLDLGVLVKVSDRLSPRVVSKSPIARFLSGEKGWTTVPLRVGGTISNPSYGVDTKAVGSKVREGVQKKLGEELQKFLPKGQPQRQPGKEQNRPSGRDLLEGIFGQPDSNRR